MKKMFYYFLFLFFAVSTAVAQEQTSETKFPIGAFVGYNAGQGVLDSYDSLALNTVVWHADAGTEDFLENYDVMAFNLNSTDWINHYSTGYYSKWESEENQTNLQKIGVKHKYGQSAAWNGAQCWSSIGLSSTKDSLVYGPHYFQAKTYRRVYGDTLNGVFLTRFIARFRMALNYIPQESNPNDLVCKIKILYRYAELNNTTIKYDTVFQEKTLKVADFPSDGSFKIFNFDSAYYYNTTIFPSDHLGRLENNSEIEYTDWIEGTGIQFCVDWLGDYNTGILYVDYAEVYDNDGWNRYVNPETHQEVIDSIQAYAQHYSNWDNIKFWYTHDEPRTIDAFIPIKTVDEIVDSVSNTNLITHFFEVNVYKNGDYLYDMFYNNVQPEKLMFNAYPFHTDTLPGHGFKSLHIKMQQSHNLQPGFYYVPQSFGRLNSQGQVWGWYKPSSAELKASTMLALAHGSKGILFSDYYKYWFSTGGGGWIDGIVDSLGNPSQLWYVIKDNLAPRLAGTFGKTLLKLGYTGNYIDTLDLGYQSDQFSIPSGYLTLFDYNPPYYWHIGFLQDKINTDNKYFLIVNLRTDNNKTAEIAITNNTPFYNVAVRDIENNPNSINTTISHKSVIFYPQIDTGDGYLIQVAPVVKYGGNLIYNDTIKTGTVELVEDMTIANGVQLIINSNYKAKETITLNGSGFITGEGYFYLEGDGEIIINDWDRSVFKSRSGNYPKLIWGDHPEYEIDSFFIYKKYQTQSFQLIEKVDSETFEYTDATVTIVVPQSEPEPAEYYVIAKSTRGETDQSNTINYFVGIDDMGKIAIKTEVYDFKLSQNYPNPYNPETIITYSIADPTDVKLAVYDILGREIKVLVNEKKEPGNYEVSFNAENLSSGVYIYRIETPDFIKSQKMVLVR